MSPCVRAQNGSANPRVGGALVRCLAAMAFVSVMAVTTGCEASRRGSLLADPGIEEQRGMALSEMPPRAEAAIRQAAGSEAIEQSLTLVRDGRPIFGARFTRDGRDRRIEVEGDGALVRSDVSGSLSEFPRDAQAAIVSQLGGGDDAGAMVMQRCWTRTTPGGMTYLAAGQSPTRKVEVEVNAKGGLIRKEFTPIVDRSGKRRSRV